MLAPSVHNIRREFALTIITCKVVGSLLEPDLALAADPPRRGPRDSSSEVKLDVSTVSLEDGQNFFVPYVYLLVHWHLRELLDPEVY